MKITYLEAGQREQLLPHRNILTPTLFSSTTTTTTTTTAWKIIPLGHRHPCADIARRLEHTAVVERAIGTTGSQPVSGIVGRSPVRRGEVPGTHEALLKAPSKLCDGGGQGGGKHAQYSLEGGQVLRALVLGHGQSALGCQSVRNAITEAMTIKQ